MLERPLSHYWTSPLNINKKYKQSNKLDKLMLIDLSPWQVTTVWHGVSYGEMFGCSKS